MPRNRHVEMAERIQLRPLDELTPYDRNARTHADTQLTKIAASITEAGFVNPLLVAEDGTIIAGHGRYEAAKRLGLSEVPVIVLSHLTEEQQMAYRIKDNQLALLSGWDEDVLAEELVLLQGAEYPLEELGFPEAELERLLEPDAGQGEGTPQGQDDPRGLGNMVVSYTLIFDSQRQQDRFFQFVRWLKSVYPDDNMTLAARLTEHVEETFRQVGHEPE